MTAPYESGRRSVFFYLALICWAVSAILIGAYLGMCSTLVADDTGGKGEWPALLFAAILALVAYFYFWPRRRRPML